MAEVLLPRPTRHCGVVIHWLVPSEISGIQECQTHLFQTENRLTQKGYESCSTQLLPVGTVAVSSRATIGDCVILGREICTNQGFVNTVCNARMNNLFLLYWLRHNKRELFRYAAGTTFDEIGRRTFKKLQVLHPVEPMDQQAIAEAILSVDSAIAATQESIAKAERLQKGLMQQLLTGRFKPDGTSRDATELWVHKRLGRIPVGWRVERLKDVTHQITDGEHFSPEFQKSGALFFSAEDVFDEGIRLDKAKFVRHDDMLRFRRRCGPEKNDVLIVSRGASVGRTCIVQIDEPFALMGSVILVKPAQTLAGVFIAYYLKSFRAWVELRRLSGTTAQQAIYIADLKKMLIAFPSDPDEQQQIGGIFADLAALVQQKRRMIVALQRVKKSLMQNLLTGRVRLALRDAEEVMA